MSLLDGARQPGRRCCPTSRVTELVAGCSGWSRDVGRGELGLPRCSASSPTGSSRAEDVRSRLRCVDKGSSERGELAGLTAQCGSASCHLAVISPEISRSESAGNPKWTVPAEDLPAGLASSGEALVRQFDDITPL